MKMYINGEWVDRVNTMPVLNPFDQSIIDTVRQRGSRGQGHGQAAVL